MTHSLPPFSPGILRQIIPRSLMSRLFWGIFAVAALSVLLLWYWLGSQIFVTLDLEASERLKRFASVLADDLTQIEYQDSYSMQRKIDVIESFWKLEKSTGWIQNLYWLDMSELGLGFIASFTLTQTRINGLLPPDVHDVEYLVYEHINELDSGQTVTPDPFSGPDTRRYKILLHPLFDSFGMLDSIIGVEADMEYLNLLVKLRKQLWQTIVVALTLSLILAFVMARSIAKRFTIITEALRRIETGEVPAAASLGIIEFDRLYASLAELARDLQDKNRKIKEAFVTRIDELAFIGGAVAHEVRNPLSALEMHVGLLRRQLGVTDSTVENAFVEINEQMRHLKVLVDNFLRYSRKISPQIEEVQLKSALTKILEAKKQVMGHFEYRLAVPHDLIVAFDGTLLQQLIENLVNNSYEACEEELLLELSAASSPRYWQLKFKDNGPGIVEDMQRDMFTPFKTSKVDGSGFGLALIKKFVEAHGGKISYNSAANGAEFIIEVPHS